MALRVAVIGAGAAGLCAARHLLSKPGTFSPPVVFESGGTVGGTWAYEERVGTYDNGRAIHSSMYQNLRTNLPKEVMMFPDFPFDPELDSFIPHQEVLRYLQQDTEESLCFVSCVWCRHYSDPHIPEIPGLRHFKGELMHSHSYRHPDPFSGKTVVVLGAKASAIDISMELSTVAQKVYLSHRPPPLTFPLPPNVTETEVVSTDSLLLCTGYNFTFPFVSGAELGVRVEADFVGPLYRHLMPPSYPSIFFIGLCTQICPFPHFHCQVQYCLAVLEGSVTLPSVQQMAQESDSWLEDRLRRGVPQRHLLRVEQEQWEYCRALANDANFCQIRDGVRALFQEVWRQRRVHPVLYRKHNYRLISDTQWERIAAHD
uniref:Flavin-containing monooxygenase n=1 Tax=Periophthalmus magnuspinnatus TaxID=409849 RepID=A0A3B4A8H1_9GOBI